jgi:hypothetical protein
MRFSYDGDDDGLRTAEAAARQWDICGERIEVGRGLPDAIPLVQVAHIEPAPGRTTLAATRVTADGEVVRVRFVPHGTLESTLAHEFGHALGLGHGAGGIMLTTEARTTDRVTAADCEALAACGGRDCRDD